MSIFSKIAAPFESAWGSLEHAAKSVWTAITGIWGFLTGIARVLDGAWVWMVNGAEWIGRNLEGWAGEVYNAIKHTLLTVIPNAVKWAVGTALHLAVAAVMAVVNPLKDLVHKLKRWASEAIRAVEHLAKDVFNKVTRWAREAVEFVFRFGKTLVTWITHPETLAQFLLAHIALPLVRFAFKIAASVGALVFRAFAALLPQMASAVEDLLAKVI